MSDSPCRVVLSHKRSCAVPAAKAVRAVWIRAGGAVVTRVARPGLALLAVGLAFALSLLLRADFFLEHGGAQGLEATYHTLWTIEALEASPPSAHHFLPTVTLDPAPGNPVRWGSTVPTSGGSYIYTSFPPLGFLAPMYGLESLSLKVTFLNLALFNALVGLGAALGIGGFMRAVALREIRNPAERERAGWLIFAAMAISYLCLRESLVSHGAVYWPHSLSQLCLVFGSWAAFRLLCGQRDPVSLGGLLVACALYPLLEWTGYVFNVGVALAFAIDGLVLRRKALRPALGLPFALAGVTLLAGGGTLLHYVLAIGAPEMMRALAHRAVDRSLRPDAVALPLGYLVSFAGLLLTGLAAALTIRRNALLRGRPELLLLFLLVTFPMVENLVMMQHATQFSFDRLKLALPLLLAMTVAAAAHGRTGVRALVAGAGFVVVTNVATFELDAGRYDAWGTAVARNGEVIGRFRRDPLAGCSLMGASGAVRGYLNMAFHRDIFEFVSADGLAGEAERRDSCALAYVTIDPVFPDLPRIASIEILDRAGHPLRRYEPEPEVRP
ncbi:hypothetical protein [Cereibacter azotoformans]|uniref:hypothetical protein n=1 Tax=Cereibacter azotoformans TaxID=43057 RepID=UPI000C6D0E7A|nr:hypothetical protein [Cereibacter azotoformans]